MTAVRMIFFVMLLLKGPQLMNEELGDWHNQSATESQANNELLSWWQEAYDAEPEIARRFSTAGFENEVSRERPPFKVLRVSKGKDNESGAELFLVIVASGAFVGAVALVRWAYRFITDAPTADG